VELTAVVERRRMTRNFTGRPPGPGVVDALLARALRSPSAGFTQGVDLVVLEGPQQTARYWEATTDEAWRQRSRRYPGLVRAPVVVLPFCDPKAYAARYAEPDKAPAPGEPPVEWVVPFWFVDAAFCAMSLLLLAADAGLGAAFLGNFRGEAALCAALGVPEGRRWLGAVLLGEPATPDPPSASLGRRRRPVDEVVHRGGW
jgi:nitroreductase